ncbi:MAG: PHP domain-containing protein [Ruminococcaceae bacterium]|nr:PHP domain-containing protein [Oscillospiraceae bacterium]
MRYKYDHDLHIHSRCSICSEDPGQTVERILQYAKDEKLHTICLTDHYWDEDVYTWNQFYKPQGFAHVSSVLPLPKADGIRYLFGCETDMDADANLGIPERRYDDFSFIIIPTTHFHMGTFVLTQEENDDPTLRGRADGWIRRFDEVLSKDLPFRKVGLAHLGTTLLDTRSREAYLKVMDLIPTEEMERLFAKAAELGVGIELNRDDMMFKDDEEDRVLRMFRIAKNQGCKFYLGSDAHSQHWLINSRDVFERAIHRLGLEESDKFIIE